MPTYRRLQQYAIAISVASIIYNGAEGGLSIGFGADSDSRSLVFFGIQSGIEVISSILVVWRFWNVAQPGDEREVELSPRELRVEKIATTGIGILLILLGLGAIGSSVASLVMHQHPDSSNASIIISASAFVIMILIWLPKRYLARALDSSAMRGEAVCSLSCIQMTFVLFVGSLVYRVWRGGWWVDSATSIVLGLFFGWEGVKMVRWARAEEFNGGCCSDCGDVEHGKGPVALPGDTELGEQEQYKDICTCCAEKEECKEMSSCQCHFEVDVGDVAHEPREACCTPVNPSGDKCCTHDLKIRARETACGGSCCSDDCE